MSGRQITCCRPWVVTAATAKRTCFLSFFFSWVANTQLYSLDQMGDAHLIDFVKPGLYDFLSFLGGEHLS